MDHPLAAEGGTGNGRNGDGRKTVVTNTGKRDLQIPRDRQASFDPPSPAQLGVRRLKDRKAVAAALKDIYRAVDAAAGEAAKRL